MNRSARTNAVWSLFILLMLLTLTEAGKGFASDEETAPSLEGLKGIAVMILPLSPDAERNGIKREQLQSKVEQKLRGGGLKILTDRELEKPGFPYLNIDVNAVKDKNPEIYAYKIKVELYKQIIQNPQDEIESAFQWVSTKTWSSEADGTASGGDLKNTVQKHVDESLDKLIQAYLAANPKK